jgi:amino acid adenylation domain-containing protein
MTAPVSTAAHDPRISAVRRVRPTNPFVEFAASEIEQSISARFEHQVRRHPDRLAVKAAGHELTYAALNAVANRLAREILARRGVGAESVALLVGHGSSAPVAIFGVLKTGKLFVPLDPSFPEARTAYVLEDSRAKIVVTDDENVALADRLTHGEITVINLDRLARGLSSNDLDLDVSPDALAFILYTSGSSGRPKGVVHNHRNALQNVLKTTNGLRVQIEDRVSFLSPYTFIGSIADLFCALLNGAAVLSFDFRRESLADFRAWLVREEVTILSLVTTVFRHLATLAGESDGFANVRILKVAGEPVLCKDVELFIRYFPPSTLLCVAYGCTEMSNISQYFADKETVVAGSIVPVGYAGAGLEILLLGEDGKPVPEGEIGEIVLKSPYLALGYWRQPEQTRAAFLPDPNGGEDRIYRTGDLGRMLPGGCLEHLGRQDFQVKVRGIRVEVAEVELALLEHDGVKEAAVVGIPDHRGETQLVAYWVPGQEPVPSDRELRAFLREQLPAHMIPSVFVRLDALPLTPNRKVDRLALPQPPSIGSHSQASFIAPRTPVERSVARVWSELLGREQIGVHDDFLSLGGDSLLATRLVSHVRDRLRAEVPLSVLLQGNTVEQMATIIVQSRAEGVDQHELARVLGEVEALPDEEPSSRIEE